VLAQLRSCCPQVAGTFMESQIPGLPAARSMIELTIMVLPRRSLFLAAWICWIISACPAQTSANGFRWDWRKSEKGNWERISQSKSLSARERIGLIELVASQLRPSMSKMEVKTEQELKDLAAQTRIKAVDLSGKGERDFLAQIGVDWGCSPTGNCDSWVVREKGDQYSAILYRTATQTFTIQPTVTNGFHDLVLGQHGSATMQELTLYRFDGSKYRSVACYDANWETVGKDGEYRQLKEPRVTSCSRT